MQLTIEHEGLTDMILGNVVITSETGKSITVRALWDTGATGSMISEDVAQKLDLKKNGELKYYHAGGASTAAIYKAAIEIQGDSKRDNLNMGLIKIPAMFDATHFSMIIGMDVISHGNFSIKNKNGNSIFSFTC